MFNFKMLISGQFSRRLVCHLLFRSRLFSSALSPGVPIASESSNSGIVDVGTSHDGECASPGSISSEGPGGVSSGIVRPGRRGVVDATLCEKYAAFASTGGADSDVTSALSAGECFELFLSQCENNSGNQISILASRLLDVLKSDSSSESLSYAIKALVRLQQAKVSYPDMLDYVSERISDLSRSQLADFTWSCYSGGLRAKHHLDVAYEECMRRLPEFELSLLMRVLRSFSYFSYEYRYIFDKSQALLSGKLNHLSHDDLLMLLNICKTLHRECDFVEFRDKILGHILCGIDEYPYRFLINCLAHLTRGRRTQIGGRFVSHVLQNASECEREYDGVKVSTLVSVMQCIELWRIRMSHLTTILRILSSRVREVTYSRNLGLWAEIYNIIYSTGWFSPEFMLAGVEHIIAEPHILHRVSSHQLVRVLQTFYKLRYYHRESYLSLLNAIMHDFDSLKRRLNVVCEALLAAADANIEFPALYESCLDHLSSSLSSVDLDASVSPLSCLESMHLWPRNVITSVWSLCVMGYQGDDRFKVLLEIMSHPCISEYNHQSTVVLMALEAAESTLISGHHQALCEHLLDIYGDAMRAQEQQSSDSVPYDVDPDDSMRDHVDSRMTFAQCQDAHFHKGRMRATKHISDILYHLGRRDVLVRVAPHYNSPYLVDLCFSNESKKGIVLYSGRELMRDHIEGKWSVVETGSTRLKRYILAHTGWRVVEISCGEWSKLQTSVDRKQFIRAALDELDITS